MEHKIVLGGEQFLPFARSRIRALRALGLPYADQSFEIDGVSIKVRIEPGHEYIRLEGGDTFVCAFSNIQFPESEIVATHAAMLARAVVVQGAYPQTVVLPGQTGAFQSSFGVTPFSRTHIRMGQLVVTPQSQPFAIDARYPADVFANSEVTASVFVNGALSETISVTSGVHEHTYTIVNHHPVDESLQTAHEEWTFSTASVKPVPSANASAEPYLFLFRAATSDSIKSHAEATYVVNDTYNVDNYGAQVAAGSSWVQALKVVTAKLPSGAYDVSLHSFDVGRTPYSYWNGTRSYMDPGASSSTPVTDVVTTEITISGDVECTVPWRRWSASTRVGVSPNGTVAVLRAVASLSSIKKRPFFGGTSWPAFSTLSTAQSYALSILTPNGVTHDNVLSRNLGMYGYIAGIIWSSGSTRLYVYYALHDDSEVLGATVDNMDLILPTKFVEYLDVVAITVSDGAYSFSLDRTITLGPVTLDYWRSTEESVSQSYVMTTQYRLRNAVIEVGGFIWADRFCYVVAHNVFVPLPDYHNYDTSPAPSYRNFAREQRTGNSSQECSYLTIENRGTQAKYVVIKAGLVIRYVLTKNKETGEYSVASTQATIAEDNLDFEDLYGVAAIFERTARNESRA